MASFGDDSTLIKIAVFGVTMSLIATACIALLISPTNDYSYDEITAYQDQLANFSGRSMINNTPWVLTDVYTPWTPSDGVAGHITADNWLFGEHITNYPDLGLAADIHLDPTQKSSKLLSYSDQQYSYVVGKQWWAGGLPGWNGRNITIINPGITDFLGIDSNEYATGNASVWDFTGYRYVFDPTLPFNAGTSSADGSLSIVWYSFDGEEGLSGGLQIYGKNILLASYSAADIIAAYETSVGYATTYDFDFDGVLLKLSVKFDQDKLTSGISLWQLWTAGNWSMAISSTSAGNFYDVENSNAFVNTAGSMMETFIDIYTLKTPSIQNAWMDVILWLLVALPMTVALLCVTLRIIQSVKPF